MSASLRVALDARPLALETVSGIGLLLSQILEELPRRGVSFVALADRPFPEGRLPPRSEVLIEGPPGHRIRWESRVLPRLIERVVPRPDLFHAAWNHGIPAGLPLPGVLSLHDLIPWRLPREVPWPKPAWLHRALYRSAVRSSARRATVIVTLSDASRRDIVERIPDVASRVEVVPCALPRWFTRPDPARVAENRSLLGDPYWLYVGGFDPRKGILTLLAAMAAAFPGGGPTLVLAGGRNEHQRSCEALARALRVNALFPGYVPDADLPALYGGASLFVYPSRYEGFGIPPLLALAAGVPCITTDGGALPEVVGDAAAVVPAGDPKALAAALRRAAEEPETMRAMAARGPAHATAFSLDALAQRMLQVYGRALDRREGHA